MGRRADVVPVVGDRLNVGVCVEFEVLARLPLVASALDDVIQVRNHARCAKRLAMIVEVDTPGIAGALGEYFKLLTRWMIAPDARVDRDAFALGRARFANL